MTQLFRIFLATAALMIFAPGAQAQVNEPKPAALPTAATDPAAASQEKSDYFYEQPLMKKLSQLYWAIDYNDINNNQVVDNFLMINECEIYKSYSTNEFEWKDIREAGREFIKKNKKTFPLRFEFIQPIKLGEYDVATSRFAILKDYQVEGIRRFEMYSPEYAAEICGEGWNIEGYPRGVVIELNRPFTLTHLTVEPALAQQFIEESLKTFRSLDESSQTQAKLYDTRDAYLIMKIKIFSSNGEALMQDGIKLANVMGVLEGFDVYTTRNKEMPIFSKSFRRRKKDNTTPTNSGTGNDGDVSDPLPMPSKEEAIQEEEYEP